tara:strand:+ start:4837 stop:5478 length:642 start_codon:yes stop_codon:yes gene_type:complete
MKNFKLLIFFTFLFFQLFSAAQESFEGTIKFKFEYLDKTGELSDDQAKQYMGTEQLYYLKKEKYKSVLNGLLNMKTFYNGNDTIFMKMSGTESLLYDLITREDEEKIISHEFTDVTEKIAGLNCKLVIVKTNKGIHKYYYTEKVKINLEYYKNHKMGNWNYFLKITNGCVSIRHESDLKDSYQKIEVITIIKEPIDDEIFERPNLPIIKMTKN